MEVVFTITLPRDSASVPVVRRLCRCSFRALGVEEDCSHDLELVVTEACTNVLKHAAGGEEYEVTVSTGERICDIRVKDTGRGIDADAHGRQEAHTSAEGGRGIHLMRVLVDRLQFVSDGSSGTVVHLEKRLELRDDSPLRRAAGAPAEAVPAVPYTG